MNKTLSTVLLVTILLLTPGQTFAHDATVVIERIGQFAVVPNEDTPITVPGFPFGLHFEGTVTHEGYKGLKRVKLQATVNGELVYGPESLKGTHKATTTGYVIPWVVYEPGEYVVEISGFHSGSEQKDSCKAAPAIANAYLKEGELDRHGADGTNVIPRVAKETGKEGSLWAKEKCAEDYFSKTITIVLDSLE
jgi:hypothetical protein